MYTKTSSFLKTIIPFSIAPVKKQQQQNKQKTTHAGTVDHSINLSLPDFS